MKKKVITVKKKRKNNSKNYTYGFFYSAYKNVVIELIGKTTFDGTEAIKLSDNQRKKIYGNLKELK